MGPYSMTSGRTIVAMALCIGTLLSVADSTTSSCLPQRSLPSGQIKVLSASEKPLDKAIVIQAAYDPDGLGYYPDVAVTNKDGVAQIAEPELVIAISSDGKIAVSRDIREIRLGRTGTVKLHLTSPSGLPLRNRMVDLAPAKEARPVKSIGRLLPNYSKAHPPQPLAVLLSKRTNRRGDVEFRNLPLGVPFSILTPIDKAYTIVFDGSVSAVSVHHLIVSHDCVITGRVRDSKGQPIRGAIVEVGMTPYIIGSLDHGMEVVGRGKTDAKGVYRIDHLPNCRLEVQVTHPGEEIGDIKFINGKRIEDNGWTKLPVRVGRSRYDLGV